MDNKIYTLEEIKQMLHPIFLANAVYQAIIFGSYAKGLATSNSDIDIVVDSKGELLNIKFYGLLEEITQKLGKKVDLIEVSEIENNSPIYETIKNEGVVVYAR
jgi:predicted nucleotidyltransferase